MGQSVAAAELTLFGRMEDEHKRGARVAALELHHVFELLPRLGHRVDEDEVVA